MSKGRILTFDYMRGYFMLCIVVNHLFMFPSLWQIFTGRGVLWVSVAEGFFFLSGLMVGLVRGNSYRNLNKFWPIAKNLFARAWVLYLANIVLVLIFIFIAHDLRLSDPTIPIKLGYPVFESITGLLVRVMSFQVVYGWADFLPYYVVFLLLSIPALWVIKKDMWYLVLGLAILGWFEPRIMDFGTMDKYYFYWQLYFFTGLVIGYYYYKISGWFASLPEGYQSKVKRWVICLFLFSYAFNWALIVTTKQFIENLPGVLKTVALWGRGIYSFSEPYLYSERSGVLRPLVFMVWLVGMYFVFQRFEIQIKSKVDWLLGEFGRQSLRVYILSSFIAFFIPLFLKPTNIVINTLISLVIVLAIAFIIRINFVKRIIPN